jgi:anaerobic selenocysteine-containing dehydrogenase
MDWLEQHADGYQVIIDTFKDLPVDKFARFAGLDPAQVREAAQVIGEAESFALEEDLGIEMAPHSTLVTYLNFLTTLMTGNYGKPGTQAMFTQLAPVISIHKSRLDENGREVAIPRLPVTGAPIVSGLYPGSYLAEEILNEHPQRPRALIVESSNPVHSLPESARMREAIRSLDFSLAVDVAMTETARECDYVLPASSTFEKWEATFFPRNFPRNIFYLRYPLFEPGLSRPWVSSSPVNSTPCMPPVPRAWRPIRRPFLPQWRRTPRLPACCPTSCIAPWGRTWGRDRQPRHHSGACARCM